MYVYSCGEILKVSFVIDSLKIVLTKFYDHIVSWGRFLDCFIIRGFRLDIELDTELTIYDTIKGPLDELLVKNKKEFWTDIYIITREEVEEREVFKK